MKRLAYLVTSVLTVLTIMSTSLLTGCGAPADVASRNLSHNADNFRIARRIVFYNSITDTYMLSITGNCAITDSGNKLTATCKTAQGLYLKHYLGLSDNVTYFVEQIREHPVDTYYHKINFRPTTIIPALEIDIPNYKTSSKPAVETTTTVRDRAHQ